MYSKEELLRGLNTRVIGSKLFVFESIDSTNICAKTLAEAGIEDGAVVFAENQTEGRGRNGRSWLSEPGNNLLFSVVLRPELPKEKTVFLTFYSAVAVAHAVESLIGTSVECKWPNDLLLNSKKFCGILLESSFQQSSPVYSVVGIGINVNQRTFDMEMGNRVTSLSLEHERDFDRKHVFQRVLEHLDRLYGEVRAGDFKNIMKTWNAKCTMFGKPVTVSSAHDRFSGKALGLSSDGGLMIETSGGTSIVYAGDVSISQ
ncbi:MAG: biotin--[acetyl-CoA-carboxylase] ligase [Ignavibacteriales bacterium]|nr:biotin--[acetyl-CoA-carboxylase] ligase [Ignavibacteriales bacterium]